LTKTDRATMSNSLELRSPFLDREFALFAMSIPSEMKFSNAGNKIILRNAYRSHLPNEIINRDKKGFGAPIQTWFAKQKIKELKEIYLGINNSVYKILNYSEVKKFIEKNNSQSWTLLCFSIWFNEVYKKCCHSKQL